MDATLETYRAAWRERARRAAAEAQVRAAQAESVLPELVRLLVGRFGATKVVLIGSLARGEFRLRSDIDLVAEGIPACEFYRAGAAVERAAGDFSVDVIPLETATAEVHRAIAEDGRVLHGRR